MGTPRSPAQGFGDLQAPETQRAGGDAPSLTQHVHSRTGTAAWLGISPGSLPPVTGDLSGALVCPDSLEPSEFW